MNNPAANNPTMLWVFAGYIVAVFGIGGLSHRMLRAGSFLSDYFLGGRSLGAWTLAFTFSATAISGGTFIGLPSLIYMNGWSLALWIGSYMLVPLVTMAMLAKRINRVGRALGSITLPDMLRDRFESPALGLLSTGLMIFFLAFYLVAQFKAGALVMQTAVGPTLEEWGVSPQRLYPWGLIIFAVTVGAYTTYGGFWGVTLTDVLEGVVMLLGAVLLVPLVVGRAGGFEATTQKLADIDPQLVYCPGPGNFLPITLALSYFLYWPLVSAGQPGNLVRLMAFKDTRALRRALLVVTVYFALTYLAMLLIFTSARALFPTEFTSPGQSDRIMPAMILAAAPPWLAGVLLAAPYAAIMSTVAAFILMISSGIVRDVYQRSINPAMTPRAARTASYAVTALVGVVITAAALFPPDFLQYVIIFSGSGLASCFLVPVSLGLFWRRMTRAGAFAAIAAGLATHTLLYALGWAGFRSGVQGLSTNFQPYYLLGLDPEIWGLLASLLAGVGVSRATAPPAEALVSKLFDAPAGAL